MDKVIRLIIAENQPLICAGFHHIFSTTNKITLVGQASTLSQTHKLCQHHQPDILLLSSSLLSNKSQLPIVSLSRAFPEMRLAMIGTMPENKVLHSLIHTDVAGFVLNSESTEAIQSAVYAIANGGNYFSEAVFNSFRDNLPQLFDRPQSEKDDCSLTARETEILVLLSQGLDNRAIADELDIGHQTVRNRLYIIYKKIGVRSRAEAILFWFNRD